MQIFNRLSIVKAINVEKVPDNLVKPFYTAYNNVRGIANLEYDAWEKAYKDIERGKFKDSLYFKPIDKDLEFVKDLVEKYPYSTGYRTNDILNLSIEYEKAKDNLLIDKDTFNLVKVGDKQEDAIKKLVKGLQDKRISKRYDPYTKDEILDEINKFNGTFKLRGANDIYIKFKNGKVVSVNF